MSTDNDVSVDEAVRLAREHSWASRGEPTCGHTGCEDHEGEGPRMIHTYGSFGCDLPLEDVEQRILGATRIAWVDHLLRHDLALFGVDGRALCLDIPRPERAA
ncbi:MAG TPA: hypothetical protein VFY84_19525 [Jiangellales bacterium]|nr:hypothetical protein [Jiangellales bacterium]